MNEREQFLKELRDEEYIKIKMFFVDVPEKKLYVIDTMIRSLAFYRVELAELEDEIFRNGITESYTNGKNQGGIKESVAVKTHLAIQKSLLKTVETLVEYLPIEKARGFTGLMERPLDAKRGQMRDEFAKYIQDAERDENETFEHWRERWNDYYKKKNDDFIDELKADRKRREEADNSDPDESGDEQ